MIRLLVNRIFFALLFSVGTCCSAHAMQDQSHELRVLFVGNSLTYVGNLPAVLEEIAAVNGQRMLTDMIVSGGATLTERWKDGSVTRALQAQQYQFVILQERGGEALGIFGDQESEDSAQAIQALTAVAKTHGAQVISLGTYQTNAGVSAALVEAESKVAQKVGIPYLPISEYFQFVKSYLPEALWLNEDKAHPGQDLILLEALLVYRELFQKLPKATSLTVNATIYQPKSRFDNEGIVSIGVASSDLATSYYYPYSTMAGVLKLLHAYPAKKD